MDFVFKEAKAELRELLRKSPPQRPWQPIPVVLAAVVPAVIFAWTYFCGCSSLRYHKPPLALVLALPSFAVAAGISAKAHKNLREALAVRGPIVLAVGCWAAVVLALFLGERNFRWHLVSYYTYEDSVAYINIDPSEDHGQAYTDAGQVYFNEASYVAIDEFVAYKSQATFCVAPILSEELGQNFPHSVDFWAVGLDCCSQATGQFNCGAIKNKAARSGLRLLRDDVRPFFALAVQEWEARKCPENDNTAKGLAKAQPLDCPRAPHPLFFHWVEDPLLEVDTYFERAKSMFGMQFVLFLVGNLVLSLLLFWGLFNLGFK